MSIYNTRRFYHTYVLGKSGYGKSTALERWAIDDILNNECTIFFDVHGESVDTIIQHIPPDRWDHTILLDFADQTSPFPFNPLHGIPKTNEPTLPHSPRTMRGGWSPSSSSGTMTATLHRLPPYTAYGPTDGHPVETMTRLLDMPDHDTRRIGKAPKAIRARSRALATQRKHVEAAIDPVHRRDLTFPLLYSPAQSNERCHAGIRSDRHCIF